MLTRYDHRGVVWIDLERPTIEEVESLVEEFALGPFLEQELLSPTMKPRIDLFPNFLYVVLHFPASRDTHGKLVTHEVDLVVLKDTVVTVHYESVPAILDFARSFEASMLLTRPSATLHAGHVLFELSTRLYQSVEDELDAIEDSVTAIEGAIFTARARELVRPLSELNREVLSHKRVIVNQDDVLHEFEQAGTALFGDEFKSFVSSMSTLQFRVSSRAQMLLETLAELRDTNAALLTTRQNEIMKNLTVMTFVMLPLSLLVSLFSMNTANTPIVGSPHDFWVVVFIMAALGSVALLYFKLKKWF
jgi:magnesium transporter